MRPDSILLSTVTPVFHGVEYLRMLVEALAGVRRRLEEEGHGLVLAESVFVDDGSTDGSTELLSRLADEHDWVHVVTMSRNFGQHAATAAGILHTSGDWVVTLDEDLQHRPEHLLSLLRRAAATGVDIVYARASGRVHGSFLRDAGSRALKNLVARVTGNPNVSLFSSFRLVRGSVGRAAASVVAHDTYLDFALSWFTDRVVSVELPMVDERFRKEGDSGYSVVGLLSHTRRMLTSAELRILRLGGAVGGVSLLLSLFGAATVLAIKLVAPELIVVRGWTSIFLLILFFGGLTSMLLGVVLEFMTTVILQVKGRPPFFVVDRSRDETLRSILESPGGG